LLRTLMLKSTLSKGAEQSITRAFYAKKFRKQKAAAENSELYDWE